MIYTTTIKPVEIKVPSEKGYCFIQGGAAISKEHFLPISDDMGISISEKNPKYSELSCIYWVWKNTSDPIVGMAHYRRFFCNNYLWSEIREYVPNRIKQFVETYVLWRCNKCIPLRHKIMSIQNAEGILNKYDIILTKKYLRSATVMEQYACCHNINDLMCLRSVIIEICPEYVDDFDAVMQENSFYYCNMFIMRREMLNKYCDWIFPILFEVEKRIDDSTYTTYQKRVVAYLAERLISVFVKHHNLRIFESQLYVLDDLFPKGQLFEGK